jgi:hypothetical protein
VNRRVDIEVVIARAIHCPATLHITRPAGRVGKVSEKTNGFFSSRSRIRVGLVDAGV